MCLDYEIQLVGNINAGQTKDYGAIEVHGHSVHCLIKKQKEKWKGFC